MGALDAKLRSPAEIIGLDAMTQLTFEGYVVLPLDTVLGLRECVEASIEGPKRDRKILMRSIGDLVPLPTFILKGQVLRAIRLLREIQ